MSRLQKISNTTIRSKMQAEQSILDIIQRTQLKWYCHLIRTEDSRGQRFPSGYRIVGGEEEGCNNHGRTKGQTS